MFFNKSILDKAQKISQKLRDNKLKISFAESCTGGLLSALFTEISGASDIFDYGFVTYSNQAKQNILGVAEKIIKEFGAVSEQCAIAMAQGVLRKSRSDIAISVTGIAGPNGRSVEKPVGLVYISFASNQKTIFKKCNFDGSRSEIRNKAIKTALDIIDYNI